MTEKPKHLLDSVSESPKRPPEVPKTASEYISADEEEQQQQVSMSPNPGNGIQRYLVAIEYIGTRFSGSQHQPNCRTVVGALKVRFYASISFVFGKFIPIFLFFFGMWKFHFLLLKKQKSTVQMIDFSWFSNSEILTTSYFFPFIFYCLWHKKSSFYCLLSVIFIYFVIPVLLSSKRRICFGMYQYSPCILFSRMLLDENASYCFVSTDWLMLGVLWLVQEAFRKFIGQPVSICCSSRTVSIYSATRFILFLTVGYFLHCRLVFLSFFITWNLTETHWTHT